MVGFDCTIGDKEFSDFTYSQTVLNFAGVPAAGIAVVPILTRGNPGIEFFDPAGFTVSTAAAIKLYSGVFSYDVTVLPDGADINDVTLFQLGGTVTGVGSMSVSKSYCTTGGSLAACPPQPAASCQAYGPSLSPRRCHFRLQTLWRLRLTRWGLRTPFFCRRVMALLVALRTCPPLQISFPKSLL